MTQKIAGLAPVGPLRTPDYTGRGTIRRKTKNLLKVFSLAGRSLMQRAGRRGNFHLYRRKILVPRNNWHARLWLEWYYINSAPGALF
jgi:hypothetical protein